MCFCWLVGRMVGQSLCQNFLKKAGKLTCLIAFLKHYLVQFKFFSSLNLRLCNNIFFHLSVSLFLNFIQTCTVEIESFGYTMADLRYQVIRARERWIERMIIQIDRYLNKGFPIKDSRLLNYEKSIFSLLSRDQEYFSVLRNGGSFLGGQNKSPKRTR